MPSRDVASKSSAPPTAKRPRIGGDRSSLAATFLGIVILVCGAVQAWQTSVRFSGIDFYHLWLVAGSVARDQIQDPWSAGARGDLLERARQSSLRSDLSAPELKAAATNYSIDSVRGGLTTVATPLLFAAVSAVSSGDYEGDLRRFQLASMVAFALAIAAATRLLGYPYAWTAVLTTALVAWYRPHESDQVVGSIASIQLAVLVACALLQSKGGAGQVVGGAVLGLLLLLKPNTVPAVLALGIVWVIRGRFAVATRNALGMGLGLAAGLVVPVLLFGSLDCWRQWLAVLPDVFESTRSFEEGNVSLSGILLAPTGKDLSPFLFALSMGAIGITARRGKGAPSSRSPAMDGAGLARESLLAIGLGCAAMVLSARLVWLHYLVLIVPLLLFALRPAWERTTGSLLVATAGAVALLFETHTYFNLPLHAIFGQALPEVWAALLLLIAGLALLPRAELRA